MRSCSVDQLGSGEMAIVLCIMIVLGGTLVVANDPYQYEDWTASYIDASPLGVMQKVSGSLSLLISALH